MSSNEMRVISPGTQVQLLDKEGLWAVVEQAIIEAGGNVRYKLAWLDDQRRVTDVVPAHEVQNFRKRPKIKIGFDTGRELEEPCG